MGGIETLIVLPVTAFHFPVVPRGKGPDQLMLDAVLLQVHLEEGGLVPVGGETVGEFRSVVRLDALDWERECLDQVFQEQGGGIGAVFLKGLHETPSGILVDGGILEETLTDELSVHKAGGGNELHVHLDTLSWTIHLLVRLRDVLGVRRMDSHDSLPLQETVETGDGTGIAAPHELYPEDDQTSIRVSPTHIRDQLDFLRGMLIGMAMGPAGEVAQGLDRAVIAPFPAVDVLSVGLIFDSSLGDAKLVSIFNK